MPRCRDCGRNRFHIEFFCTQASHYSSIINKIEHGYAEMPKVEEMLASYLSPKSSLSIKSLVLPTKPVRTTSALVEKAYSAAGQAAACLHTMSLRQAYQGELLADLDEGGGIGLCSLSSTTSHCPAVAGQSMVSRYNIPPRRASSGAPCQEGPSVPSRGLDISPHPELWRLWAWPLRGPSSPQVSQPRLLRPFYTPELLPWGNFMPWSGEFSLHGVVTISRTQLTAQLVHCWSSCKSGSLQG